MLAWDSDLHTNSANCFCKNILKTNKLHHITCIRAYFTRFVSYTVKWTNLITFQYIISFSLASNSFDFLGFWSFSLQKRNFFIGSSYVFFVYLFFFAWFRVVKIYCDVDLIVIKAERLNWYFTPFWQTFYLFVANSEMQAAEKKRVLIVNQRSNTVTRSVRCFFFIMCVTILSWTINHHNIYKT